MALDELQKQCDCNDKITIGMRAIYVVSVLVPTIVILAGVIGAAGIFSDPS